MDTLSVNVRYRPIRIGWCVRAGDFEALREAWRLCTTMWGGNFNPIIPVDNPELAHRLVNLFRVDVLRSITDDPTIESFIKEYPHLPNPNYNDSLFVNDGTGGKRPTFLDISHPILKLYEEHFKNVPDPNFGVALFKWDSRDALSDIYLSTLGAPPSEEVTGCDYFDSISQYFGVEPLTLAPTAAWPSDYSDSYTLFQLGRFGIQRHHSVHSSWSHPGFYIGSVQDFDDLVNYWNLRATDSHLMFFDEDHADRFGGIRKKWLEKLRARPKGRFKSDDAIAVWSKDREKMRDLEAFGEGLRICTADYTIWNGLNVNTPYVYFSEGSTLANVGTSYGKQRVSFQLPNKPVPKDRQFYNQKLVISLDMGMGLFGNERSTLATPFIPKLNEFYGRNYYFEWNKARVEPEGVGIISDITRDDLSVNPIEINQLIEQVFNVTGISAKPSKPGLIASRLIQQLGGLQNCRPFKIAGVRDLIEKFGPEKSFTRSGAIQTIRAVDPETNEVGFSLYEDLYIDGGAPTPDGVLSYLMKKSVFRAGLEFECPSCRLDFWVELDDICMKAACAYCGHNFNITPHLNHRGDWRFRRSGLFGRADNQEGAIPVMMTLQQLGTVFSMREMLYTTAMELTSDIAGFIDCETDFVAVVPKRDGNLTQIAIGECKTRQNITLDDITKLSSVVAAFPSDNFEVFVILAKLTAFSVDEIRIAAKLNDKYHRRAILFTERELEPYFLYDRTAIVLEKERIGVSSFEDMANVTHDLYFKDLTIAED